MAYSDYGAFVYCNGERRRDKEDVAVFATDKETFGESSENIPSCARIWASLLHQKKTGKNYNWLTSIHHGILGDGSIRVLCHKQGLPQIYEAVDDEIKEVAYCGEDVDRYDYTPIRFNYKGYKFLFESGKPYEANMIEPNGTEWRCDYDYMYGAGF